MKLTSILLEKHYLAALRKHLKVSSPASTGAALRLGRRTVASGLETLDLARIHEQAFTALVLPSVSPKMRVLMTKRAGKFFLGANAPVEATHPAAAQTELRLRELQATLGMRVKELAAANVQVRHGLARRKVMEGAYERRAKRQNKCLEQSLQLQKRLRQLNHRLLEAQEDQSRKISRELENETAQTLVAINVRLLTLRQEALNNTQNFKDEIAHAQRLVVELVQTVRQGARKVGNS